MTSGEVLQLAAQVVSVLFALAAAAASALAAACALAAYRNYQHAQRMKDLLTRGVREAQAMQMAIRIAAAKATHNN